jgi:alkylresorcinol/alkylpyrone synthase
MEPLREQAISIAATATAVPANTLTREQVKFYFEKVFGLEERRLQAMMTVIDNGGVDRRFCIQPVEYFVEPRPLEQISREYQEHAIKLGEEAATKCLAAAGLEASDVDLLITLSCTGVMIPSLDAHLMNRMGFRSDVRRLPITELGCAAGAAGLGRARDFVRAIPNGTALVIAVEIPTLTFQRRDLSQANLISCTLFGDGAAAAVVTGRETKGPRILGSTSYLFPNSLDAMGFDLKDSGFHIVLSRDVPDLIRGQIGRLVKGFLAEYNVNGGQPAAYVLHPGGQKLLRYMQEELELPLEKVRYSWDVLRCYGNLSSASVLFVLHEWMEHGKLASGDYGLLAAFGPGFSAEMLMLQWA